MSIKPNQVVKIGKDIIPAEQVSHGSTKRMICLCDCCGKEVNKIIRQYYKSLLKNEGKYYCKECFTSGKISWEKRNNKSKETCLGKYGTDNPMKSIVGKNNMRKSLNNKYGVDNPGQIQEGIEKRKQTCLDKYGVTNVLVLSDNSSCHSSEARQKAMKTYRERHGGVGFEIPQNKQKADEALANSGKIRTSKQQNEVYEFVKTFSNNCELNKSLGTLFLDISTIINNIKIDIEVDGDYWHKDKQKDRARDEFVKKQGYKILRIRFDHKLPSLEDIKSSIYNLINSEHTFYELISSDLKT